MESGIESREGYASLVAKQLRRLAPIMAESMQGLAHKVPMPRLERKLFPILGSATGRSPTHTNLLYFLIRALKVLVALWGTRAHLNAVLLALCRLPRRMHT